MPAIVHLTDTFNVYSFIAEKRWTRAIMRRTCQFICSGRFLLLPSAAAIFPFSSRKHPGGNWLRRWNFNEIVRRTGAPSLPLGAGGCVATGAHADTHAPGRELGQPSSRCTCPGRRAARKGALGARAKLLCTHICGKSPLVRGWPAVDCKTRSQRWFLKKYIGTWDGYLFDKFLDLFPWGNVLGELSPRAGFKNK